MHDSHDIHSFDSQHASVSPVAVMPPGSFAFESAPLYIEPGIQPIVPIPSWADEFYARENGYISGIGNILPGAELGGDPSVGLGLNGLPSPRYTSMSPHFSSRPSTGTMSPITAQMGHSPTLSMSSPSTSKSAPSSIYVASPMADPGEPPSIVPPVGKISTKPRKKHACTIDGCDKTFNRPADLRRHMCIHTGERQHVCPLGGCGKAFIQRTALNIHIGTHTGEKTLPCGYPGCSKMFNDSSALCRHRRIHTGIRSHHCTWPGCSRSFSRKARLTQHMAAHEVGQVDDAPTPEMEEEASPLESAIDPRLCNDRSTTTDFAALLAATELQIGSCEGLA